VFAESPLRGSICVKMFVPIFVRGDDSSAYDFAAYHAGCVQFLKKKSTVQTKDSPSHQICDTCMSTKCR
jgi:hypothetical protein